MSTSINETNVDAADLTETTETSTTASNLIGTYYIRILSHSNSQMQEEVHRSVCFLHGSKRLWCLSSGLCQYNRRKDQCRPVSQFHVGWGEHYIGSGMRMDPRFRGGAWSNMMDFLGRIYSRWGLQRVLWCLRWQPKYTWTNVIHNLAHFHCRYGAVICFFTCWCGLQVQWAIGTSAVCGVQV